MRGYQAPSSPPVNEGRVGGGGLVLRDCLRFLHSERQHTPWGTFTSMNPRKEVRRYDIILCGDDLSTVCPSFKS